MYELSMKKSGLIIFGLCILILSIWLVVKMNDRPLAPEARYTIPRHIQYAFTLRNRTNRMIKGAEFWTHAPVEKTATQHCVKIKTSHPYRLIKDELGNRILHFTFHELPPYTTKIISIKAELLLSDTPNLLPEKDLNRCLQAERYCEADAPEISRLAKRLKGPETVKTAENIFRWVSGNLQYAGYVRNSRGALQALKSRKGDCTEFMYLFAALCRASNIPARGMGGYVYNENAILRPNDYHNWVALYLDNVWRIADPQRKVFMGDPSRYIAMRRIGHSYKNPMGGYYRFRIKGDGIKVKMNI